MKYISLVFLLMLAVLFEGSLTTVPLVLVFLLVFTALFPTMSIIPYAFVAGIFLDSFAMRPLGVSSIFFIVIISLVRLYGRKFEINKSRFVGTATFVSTGLYLLILGYDTVVAQALICGIFAIALLKMIQYLTRRSTHHTTTTISLHL